MDGQQHAIEDGEADRVGVDGGERTLRDHEAVLRLVQQQRLAARDGRQPSEDQQVVPGGVVKV